MSTVHFRCNMSTTKSLIVTPNPPHSSPCQSQHTHPSFQSVRPKAPCLVKFFSFSHISYTICQQFPLALSWEYTQEFDVSTTVTILVQIAIISYLKYHSVPLKGLPASAFDLLESILSTAARVILLKSKPDHAQSPLMTPCHRVKGGGLPMA